MSTPPLPPPSVAAAPTEKKGRGCFFYGCLALIIAFLILGVGGCLVIRYLVNSFVDQWFARKPIDLPRVEMSADQVGAVQRRAEAFQTAVEAGTATNALVLTAGELNALIARSLAWKDKVFLDFEGSKVRGLVSIPLDKVSIPFIGGALKGRFLNGKVVFSASVVTNQLSVKIQALEVNDRAMPAEVLEKFQTQNPASDWFQDQNLDKFLNSLQSVEITNGTVVLRPVPKP